MVDDSYDLARFVVAQNDGETYVRVTEELRRGRKTSHWMWFVFSQVAGRGQSPTSRKFAISSLDEPKAYLQHAVLGRRLLECAERIALAMVSDTPGCYLPLGWTRQIFLGSIRCCGGGRTRRK
jgi:uncharacterized protein (DUF1810 family)